MRKKQCLATAVAVTLLLAAVPAFARSPRVIDDNDRVPLRGNVHPNARPEFDAGPAESTLPMERMILTLHMPPEKKQKLDQLLAEQHDPNSPNFQHWLTPEEFAERFAPDPEDLGAIKGWLTSQGFTIDEVSRGRTSIDFSGNVDKVEKAFRTKIRKYVVDGTVRHANAKDPEIPRGLADVVAGVATLHDFGHKPMNTGAKLLADINPEYTYSSSIHWMSPIDFAAIYNVNPLYTAGYDGTGQTIAVVGRTHPTGNNWTDFRNIMGLPVKAVTLIVNGTDPGSVSTNEDNEADLDVEWAGAIAKNATVQFVTTKTTATTDGVDLSAKYIVDHNEASVMTTSFGLCEQAMGTTQNTFYNNLWQQAAAQGITSFVAAGDSGAAGCSAPDAASGSGLGINGIASTPYNVAVGGTNLNDAGGGYWRATNGLYYNSAIGYIPESAWNESGSVSGGYQLWATGSGLSNVYSKPSWQVAPGVTGTMRSIPDVSLTASSHIPYLVRSKNALYTMSGTSAASPAFASIMALIVQKTGARQGNANVKLYQLGNAQYSSTGPAIFHDTTTGNSSVPGVTGFSCTAGYDLVTGLGSVDANALVTNWPQAAPLAISASSVANGTQGVAYSATLSASGGSAPYTWTVTSGSLASGLTLSSGGTLSGTPTSTGVFGFTVLLSDSTNTTVSKNFSLAVSATACSNQPVRIAGATPVLYPDFSSAYLAAASGADLQLQALDFTSDFIFDRDLSVSLSGGNNCAYTDNSTNTGILGKIRVSRGTVAVDKLVLK